jgi:hypothetical protein
MSHNLIEAHGTINIDNTSHQFLTMGQSGISLSSPTSQPNQGTPAPQMSFVSASAFALIVCALAFLLYGYKGLAHDAKLYAAQALAHLNPATLGNDIYLRYGSQDDYTIFAPLYAQLVALLGLESAAATITFLSLWAFLFAAWRLSKSIAGHNFALVSLALLVALPSDYGAGRIFHYIEAFATPRLAAEALLLLAICEGEKRQWRLLPLYLLPAALLHPLMTAPVMLILLLRHSPIRAIAYGAGIAGALGFVGIAALQSSSSAQSLMFDEFWFQYGVTRVPYLLADNWIVADWSSIFVTALTLICCWTTTADLRLRKICLAAILCTAIGIAATWIGVDWLRLIVVTQGQPWRVLWIAGVIAVITLPVIVTNLWQAGKSGQGVVLLLAATWLLRGEVYALQVGAVTLIALLLHQRKLLIPQHAGGVRMLAIVLACFAIIWSISNSVLLIGRPIVHTLAPTWIDAIRSHMIDGLLPAAFLGLTSYCAYSSGQVAKGLLAIISATCIVCAALLIRVEWMKKEYDASVQQYFAKWRQIIPVGTEVAWLTGPFETWVLLERPSYLSSEQSVSALFSRAAAVELHDRQRKISAFLYSEVPPQPAVRVRDVKPTPRPPTPAFKSICESAPITYLITFQKLDVQPVDTIPADAPNRFHNLNLYQCPG